jgi:hypothetical protein
MKQYRISKYNPSHRIDGKYQQSEWTSFSDIGKSYAGETFTLSAYEKVENHYVDFACAIAADSSSTTFQIHDVESTNPACRWLTLPAVTADALADLVRDCLREECWCMISTNDFFLHFGYDYYMYVGCSQGFDFVRKLAENNDLFCEIMDSPYGRHDE